MFNVNNTYIRISGCIINVPLNQDMKPVFVLITKADGFSNNDEYNSVKIYNDNYVSYYIDDWGNQD